MKLDRSTLDFLNSFSDDEKNEGQKLQRDGAVTQIHGNHLFFEGLVKDDDWTCRARIRLQGNDWVGQADDKSDSGRAALYATMLERIARNGNLPETPQNSHEEKTLTEIIEERLGRGLTGEEDEYLSKIERRFRRFEIEREIFDSDLVRLNPRWPVQSFDPLTLWPTPPKDLIEFWNYIAHVFERENYPIPAFLEAITDREGTQQKMAQWERRREESEWRYQIETFEKRPSEDPVENLECRLRISTREARLLIRRGDSPGFEKIADADQFRQLAETYDRGGFRLSAASEILWGEFRHLASRADDPHDGSMSLDDIDNCRILNRLFHQNELLGQIVNLDDQVIRFASESLHWTCRVDPMGSGDYSLQLMMGTEQEISHTLHILPGEEILYLSDEWVLRGPEYWRSDEALINPQLLVPRSVIESESGVAFLSRIGAELPATLSGKIREEALQITFELGISSSATATSTEHMLLKIIAANESATHEEVLGRAGWEVVRHEKASSDQIVRYERSLQRRVLRLIAPMQPVFDGNLGCYRARVTKNFPERYAEWLSTLPEEIQIIADADLATLQADPVEAHVSFEITGQEIDWFDLKVVLKVEGMDLSQAEIRSLVQARGEFVRMERGGWLRLKMSLSDQQKEAIARIGLDPFDLTGETHRLHALQLAEGGAKEIFDSSAWEKISTQAMNVTLQVRPEIPSELNVHLRPYQIEGFHFLSYLSVNRFGGILADDMGLGKTIQALTWLLWMRENAGGNRNQPSLVVCPKSVLDVWGDEVKKAAPSIRVQVLRNKVELEVERLGKDIDLLVVNYSQLRTCADELKGIQWLGIILDEGQQIKNPDSKAAKAARSLQGENRLVLTGTPIENRLLDVWSLMSFAMPGILGDKKYFREQFDRRKDNLSQTRLTARLRPFLLRRTKGEVALDLPAKIEEDVFSQMEGVQIASYQAELERIQKILLGIESDESLRKNSFVILQGLMRLRQICCHPGLLDPKLRFEESAKLHTLFYLLDQLHEEGHKVLVFSQFVSMLDIIKEELEERDRPFSYLTGQTKNRHEVISDFQESKDPKTFLLSLKAGGSGLNLTAASYVILYDPWWNPAVESQAIDRCHRIGQTSRVNAYRLLVRDSVEEKIRLLQRQKSEMMTSVLGEEGFTRNLELEDLKFLFSMGRTGETNP